MRYQWNKDGVLRLADRWVEKGEILRPSDLPEGRFEEFLQKSWVCECVEDMALPPGDEPQAPPISVKLNGMKPKEVDNERKEEKRPAKRKRSRRKAGK